MLVGPRVWLVGWLVGIGPWLVGIGLGLLVEGKVGTVTGVGVGVLVGLASCPIAAHAK